MFWGSLGYIIIFAHVIVLGLTVAREIVKEERLLWICHFLIMSLYFEFFSHHIIMHIDKFTS